MLEEHAELVECDLLRFYGVDLLDLYRQPQTLTVRRVAVLLRGLPPDAATVRVTDPQMQWSVTDYLLAGVIDHLAVANWLTIELHKRKGSKNPYPDPVPRPADEVANEPSTRNLSGYELADWLKEVG